MKGGIVLAQRNRIVCDLKTGLPETISVTAHDGEMTFEELARYGANAPAVVVTCMEMGDVKRLDAETAVGFAVFVITSDKKLRGTDLRRGDQALVLSECVLKLLTSNGWGDRCVEWPENIRAQNLYDARLDKRGLAMWLAAFQERISLDAEVSDDELVDLELWTDFDTPDHGDAGNVNISTQTLPEAS